MHKGALFDVSDFVCLQVWKHDALADTPYFTVTQWNASLEFGHLRHPNVRLLAHCFPAALFVLNTRSLVSYARSKVSWETSRTRRGLPSAPCAAASATATEERKGIARPNTSAPSYELIALKVIQYIRRPSGAHALTSVSILSKQVCDAAVVRERLHRAYLGFIMEVCCIQ